MTNSNRKGKKGEREAAKAWTQATGRPSRRGQQHKGGNDSPDITDPDFHFEVKSYARLKRQIIVDAIMQAGAECGDKIPIVLCRQNRGPWLVAVDDFWWDMIDRSLGNAAVCCDLAWMNDVSGKTLNALADINPMMARQVLVIQDGGDCCSDFTVCRLEDLSRVCGAMM